MGAVLFDLGACRSRAKSGAEATQPAGVGPLTSVAPQGNYVILGRLFDTRTLTAREQPLTAGAPEIEVNAPAADFAAALHHDETLEGFRLSTGKKLWQAKPYAPCRSLLGGEAHVYAACGEKILAYAMADGSLTELKRANATEVVAARGLVATLDGRDGTVELYDARTNRMLAARVLPEIPRPWHYGLVASPAIAGICAFGVHVDPSRPDGWAYKAGCYDRKLAPIWTKVGSFPFPSGTEDILTAASSELIRQTGPFHLVLDHLPAGEAERSSKGRGVVVRWKDGTVEPFEDHTFATIEDGNGTRIKDAGVLEILSRKVEPLNPGISADVREARVVSDGGRAFALIIQERSTTLASVDIASRRVLFVVHVPLGVRGWRLELVAGMPVVRTDSGGSWTATIHDPGSGRVAFRDERRYR